jgi:hypothetical protein
MIDGVQYLTIFQLKGVWTSRQFFLLGMRSIQKQEITPFGDAKNPILKYDLVGWLATHALPPALHIDAAERPHLLTRHCVRVFFCSEGLLDSYLGTTPGRNWIPVRWFIDVCQSIDCNAKLETGDLTKEKKKKC